MCGATSDVRHGPEADIHSIISSARESKLGGTGGRLLLAEFKFTTGSYSVLRRHLHGQVGRLLALEDAVTEGGCSPVGIKAHGSQNAVKRDAKEN